MFAQFVCASEISLQRDQATSLLKRQYMQKINLSSTPRQKYICTDCQRCWPYRICNFAKLGKTKTLGKYKTDVKKAGWIRWKVLRYAWLFTCYCNLLMLRLVLWKMSRSLNGFKLDMQMTAERALLWKFVLPSGYSFTVEHTLRVSSTKTDSVFTLNL